jgi:hypothetical protein
MSKIIIALSMALIPALAFAADGNMSLEQPFPASDTQPKGYTSPNIPESNASASKDEYGKVKRDFNASNDRDIFNVFMKDEDGKLRNFGAEAKGSSAVRAFTEGKLGEQYSAGFSSNEPISNERLKLMFPDSNLSRGIDKMEDFVKIYKSRAHLNSDIQCYVAREINPVFVCSRPEVGTTPITYAVDEGASYEEALKKCEPGCVEEHTCVKAKLVDSLPVANPTIYSVSKNLSVEGGAGEITPIKIEPTYRLSSVELTLLAEAIEGADTNATGIQRIDAAVTRKFIDADNNETHTSAAVNLSEFPIGIGINKISVPISLNNVAELKLRFYRSEINATVTLQSIAINYYSTEHWFCEGLQAVDSPLECADGKTQEMRIGEAGSAQKLLICRSAERDIGEDTITGGFYTKDTCEAKCMTQHPCVPRYQSSNDASFNVTYGCVDNSDGTNPSCSDERCAELLSGKELITNERVSIAVNSNPTYVTTVEGGAVKDDIYRPKLDLLGEFKAREDNELRRNVFLNEEKDGAFAEMLDRGNYTIFDLAKVTEQQSAAEWSRDPDDKTELLLNWLLKPASAHVNNGVGYYLYLIVEVEQTVIPKMDQVTVCDGLGIGGGCRSVPPSSVGARFIHKTFFALNNAGKLSPFRFHEGERFGNEVWVDVNMTADCSAQGAKHKGGGEMGGAGGNDCYITERQRKYVWGEYAPYKNQSDKKRFVKYEKPYYQTETGIQTGLYYAKGVKFDFDAPFKRYEIFNNGIGKALRQDGVFVKNYDGKKNPMFDVSAPSADTMDHGVLSNYRIHAFYDSANLTASAVLKKITPKEGASEKNPYEIFAMGGEKSYNNYIAGDGDFSSTASMILQGNIKNMTVWGLFRPDSDERFKDGFFYLILREKSK